MIALKPVVVLVVSLMISACSTVDSFGPDAHPLLNSSSGVNNPGKTNKVDFGKTNWTKLPKAWSVGQIDLHTSAETRYSDLAYMLNAQGYPVNFEPSKAVEKIGAPLHFKGSVSTLVNKLAQDNNWVVNYEESNAQLRESINLRLVLEDKGITDRYIGALLNQQGFAADTSVAGVVRVRCNRACTEKLGDIVSQFNEAPLALSMSVGKYTFLSNKPVLFSEVLQGQGQTWPGKSEIYETVVSESDMLSRLGQFGIVQPLTRNLSNVLPGSRIYLKELGLDISVTATKNLYKINLRSETDKFSGDILTSGNKKIVVVTPKDKSNSQTIYVLSPSVRMLNSIVAQKEAVE